MLGSSSGVRTTIVDAVGSQHHGIYIAVATTLNHTANIRLRHVAERYKSHSATLLQFLGQTIESKYTILTLHHRRRAVESQHNMRFLALVHSAACHGGQQ